MLVYRLGRRLRGRPSGADGAVLAITVGSPATWRAGAGAGRRGGSRTRRRARQVTIAPGEATVTLHFLHLGRTGGTAIQRTLRGAGFAHWKDEHPAATPETSIGRI